MKVSNDCKALIATVSYYTFCPWRRQAWKVVGGAWHLVVKDQVDISSNNYQEASKMSNNTNFSCLKARAPSARLKRKQNFFLLWPNQASDEPALKPGITEKQHIPNH